MWQSYPVGSRPDGWIELSENGWGAVAAWFAGPGNVVREPRGGRAGVVRVSCEAADGTAGAWTEPISAAEVRDMEDGIDAYLEDAMLPPRPRGFRWFLRLPAGVQDEQDFWRRINEADSLMPHGKRDMARAAANVGGTIKDLYMSSGSSPENRTQPGNE